VLRPNPDRAWAGRVRESARSLAPALAGAGARGAHPVGGAQPRQSLGASPGVSLRARPALLAHGAGVVAPGWIVRAGPLVAPALCPALQSRQPFWGRLGKSRVAPVPRC